MKCSKTEPLSLKANTLWNAVGCFIYLGCQWLTTVLVVILSSSYVNSGMLAFAMSSGIIFASIALYKIRTFQVSDLNNEYSSQSYIAFRLITITGGGIFCLGYLLIITNDSTYLIASIFYLLFKADEVFSDVLYGIEQCHSRMDYIGKSQILRGISSLVGFCIPLALTNNLYFAILGMAACCILITISYDLPHAKLFESIKPRISKSTTLSLAKACFLAMLASLFANAIVSATRQYFGINYGDETLGIYASIATPAVLIQVAATYLYSPMIGSLARSLHNESVMLFKKRFLKMLGIIVSVIAVFATALSLIGAPMLELIYGSSISSYTYLFPYVLAATGSVGVLFYVNDILIVLRRMVVMIFCNAVALISSIVSILLFAPITGMNGISLAIITASLFGSLLGIVSIISIKNKVRNPVSIPSNK